MDADPSELSVGRSERREAAQQHQILTLCDKKDGTMIRLMEDRVSQAELLTDRAELRRQVELVVRTSPVIDIHTHVFSPEFDGMFLHGIDDLITYHYLIDETFRSTDLPHARF